MPTLHGVDPLTGTRTLSNAREWLHAHLDTRSHPFNAIAVEEARRVVDGLPGLEPEPWAEAWLAAARTFEARALAALSRDRPADAREAWWQAYQFAFLGRYPTPLHPAKQFAYDEARRYFLKAGALDGVERVEVPIADGDREGRDRVTFYLARPDTATASAPVVLVWGGVDAWKEETYVRTAGLRRDGIATIHLDMPGVGESPLFAGPRGERMWDPVFDWIDRSDLDSARVAVLGLSFGGYWAMKLAHTHRERLTAAVNWGGGVHRTFQVAWQERSRGAGSYLMDLMAARARIFGGTTFEDYIARCPELSLLDQGVLDRPSCDLLLVNGKDDRQNDPTDTYLSLEHGSPKTARLFPGGHMGDGPVGATVAAWLRDRLAPANTAS